MLTEKPNCKKMAPKTLPPIPSKTTATYIVFGHNCHKTAAPNHPIWEPALNHPINPTPNAPKHQIYHN